MPTRCAPRCPRRPTPAGCGARDRAALVDPARLVWGLKGAAEALGVRIYEDTKATSLEKDGVGALVTTPLGRVRAAKVALATNAFKPLLKRLGYYVVPVYDYCMVTEPLSAAQLASVGWANRQGVSDISNQFHYYRLTEDNRILWGGYDTIYFWRGKVNTELESRPEIVGHALQALLRHVPATRGAALHPRLGRGDRHVQPVLRVLGPGDAGPGGVRARLHGARAWPPRASAPR